MENPLCYGMLRVHDWYQKGSVKCILSCCEDSDRISSCIFPWWIHDSLKASLRFRILGVCFPHFSTSKRDEHRSDSNLGSTWFMENLEHYPIQVCNSSTFSHVSQQLLSGFKSVHWYPLIRSWVVQQMRTRSEISGTKIWHITTERRPF